MIKRICYTFLVLTVSILSNGQVQNITKTYNPAIKSIKLSLVGAPLSGPYIDLKSQGQLLLEFDELGYNFKNYQYTLVHCNQNWTTSSLLPMEYLDGYQEDYINTSATSFNTLTDYIHYSLKIPNEYVKFKKSGNYLLKVYEVGNIDKPAFTFRFVVFEGMSRISGLVKRSDVVQERDFLQEVDFNVLPPFTISNPFTDLKATILQNNRWDNAIIGLVPTFARESELIFNYDKQSSFQAGNEYRYLDLKTLRYQTERVAKIITSEGQLKVNLITDQPRKKYPYATYQELNGNFVIRNEDGTGSPETDADYAEVTFTLPLEPVSSGSIYVSGDFMANQYNETNQMKYNYDLGAYTCKLYLKQGYYNYQYVLVTGDNQSDNTFVDGCFFQTENNYTVIIYFRDFAADYDRVIGMQQLNSIRN